MKLSEEQVRQLLDWFAHSSETRKRDAEKRRATLEENHRWIQPDIIQKMSDEEMESRFLEYYRSGAGRQTLNQIYRDRIIRDKSRFRRTILHLLDETIDIRRRVDQIISGEYRIEGFGKAILTSFLMDFNPNRYCLWNNKTDMGFSALGWEVYESRDSRATAYVKVLEKLQDLASLSPQLSLTFDDVDLFLHTISAENEGREAISALRQGGTIVVPTVEAEGIPEGVGTMEFAMEKYLEEFIEANFDRIDFGATLELCQDEENSGRQYTTPVGNIDLLAIDRQKDEFVVIELKKGASSDAVVGQILRYMGWVKEHLAKSQGVRGIIIAKETDERLQYALSVIPNVALYSYNVSFSLHKKM